MKEPKAVEVLQNADGKWEVKGYWEGDLRSEAFETRWQAKNDAVKKGFIVCERPKPGTTFVQPETEEQ